MNRYTNRYTINEDGLIDGVSTADEDFWAAQPTTGGDLHFDMSSSFNTMCPHRLPCGLCKLTNKDCPKGYNNNYEFTCKG